jgi:hypothetical protein
LFDEFLSIETGKQQQETDAQLNNVPCARFHVQFWWTCSCKSKAKISGLGMS